jgi:hypothetical protein
MEENMDTQINYSGEIAKESDLFKAVKLLEENGFYVVYADFGLHCKEHSGALEIRAYPKRTVSVELRPDVSIHA